LVTGVAFTEWFDDAVGSFVDGNREFLQRIFTGGCVGDADIIAVADRESVELDGWKFLRDFFIGISDGKHAFKDSTVRFGFADIVCGGCSTAALQSDGCCIAVGALVEAAGEQADIDFFTNKRATQGAVEVAVHHREECVAADGKRHGFPLHFVVGIFIRISNVYDIAGADGESVGERGSRHRLGGLGGEAASGRIAEDQWNGEDEPTLFQWCGIGGGKRVRS